MTDKEKTLLWDKYIETRDSQIRDKLIVEYAQLVKIIAGRLSMYFGSNIEYDDIEGYGIIGLIDSIDKFNTSLNVKFETYASIRIRGSIMDQIRKLDWVPRTIRTKQKHFKEVENELSMQLGRKPTDQEMIEKLGISEDEYYITQAKLIGTNLIYLDDNATDDNTDDFSVSDTLEQSTFISPEGNLMMEELKETLKKAILTLTDKERQVIELYYYEELTMKEISRLLSVTESRTSQLHSKALGKLKVHLGDYVDIFYKAI